LLLSFFLLSFSFFFNTVRQIILLDLQLDENPDSGLSLALTIHSSRSRGLSEARIIAMSAGPYNPDRTYASGICRTLLKPVKHSELLTSLLSAIGILSLGEAAAADQAESAALEKVKAATETRVRRLNYHLPAHMREETSHGLSRRSQSDTESATNSQRVPSSFHFFLFFCFCFFLV